MNLQEPPALAAPPLLRNRRRISVLIPAYNHAAYIGEAIASVLAQDWPDIELLIVDDGSPDTTLEVATHAIQGEKRVKCRLESQANAGVSATLNSMMAMASGDVLAILNSDDSYAPQRLRTIMQRVDRAETFFAFSHVNFIESGRTDDFVRFRDWYNEALLTMGQLPSVGFSLLLSNASISSSNFVFSRDLAARSGGFDPALPLTQDWDFILRCLHAVEPIVVAQRLLNYRVHPSNTWRRHADIRLEQCTGVLQRYFNPPVPPENPWAPSYGGWPRLFPMFLCIAAPVLRNAELIGTLQRMGQSAHWPRQPGAPTAAQERQAISRLIAAATSAVAL